VEGRGEAESKGMELFVWPSNAGCSLLLCPDS
jgi:hypothetical protein